MIKKTIKDVLLAAVLLSTCSCSSNPSGLTKEYFKDKKWVKWQTRDGSIQITIAGSYFNKYTSGVGSISGAEDKYYYARFVFNAEGNPKWDFLQFYKMDGSKRIDYTFDLKAVMIDKHVATDKIMIVSSSGEETILYEEKMNNSNIDLREVVNAKILSTEKQLEFNHTFDSESLQSGAVYFANFNNSTLKLHFENDFKFTIRENWDIKCSGSYFATRETVKLTFDTNEIFDSSESIDFDLLFDNKIDS